MTSQLKKILDRQRKFQLNFFNVGKLNDEDRKMWTKEFVLALHQELTEVMQSINWKKYHKYDRIYKKSETQEELVDCFKFLLNLMIVWDVDEKDIVRLFDKKSSIVEKRFNAQQPI
jgi:dimeric dUTPase (all-alpha-NTP-PPase superfamily)